MIKSAKKWTWRGRTRWMSLAMLAAIAVSWFQSFSVGVEAGHARNIGAFGPFTFALAAVYTDRIYDLERYVYFGALRGTTPSSLTESAGLHWGMKSIDNEAEIERAIAALAAIPRTAPPEDTVRWPYRHLTGVGWGMDIGYVDFVDLAFWLFGPNVSSLYFTYHLLVVISLGVFVWRFAGNPAALGAVGLFTATLWLMVASGDFFQIKQIIAINNPRFLSSLGLVPALFVLFAFIEGKRPDWRRVLQVVVQSVILFFAFHNRTSAIWSSVALAGAAWVRFCFGAYIGETLARSIKRLWPVGAMLATVLAGVAAVNAATHPAMHASHVTPRHSFWTALVTGLQNDPLWKAKYGIAYAGLSGSDEVLFEIANRYYARHPIVEDPIRPRGFGWPDRVDRALKSEVVDLARNDPAILVNLVVSTNPYLTRLHLEDVTNLLWQAIDGASAAVLAVLSAGIVGAIALGTMAAWAVWATTGTLALGFALSLVPGMVTVVYPATLVDTYFMMVMSFIWIVASVLGLGLRAALRRLASWG